MTMYADVAAGQVPLVPECALRAGFSNDPIGTHTGKTMMLRELQSLLAASPGVVDFGTYRSAAVDDNALDKSTSANRTNTLMYLKQLYGLRPELPVFGALRELWHERLEDQPMIALLCALARDVLFRSTATLVLAAEHGALLGGRELTSRLNELFPGRYSRSTMRNLGQNMAASWTQGGLLEGARDKRRVQPSVNGPAVVYALYLGHLAGHAGPSLFSTLWARTLDRTEAELRGLAETAARSGWLEYRSSGGMMEITFHHLDGVTGWDPS